MELPWNFAGVEKNPSCRWQKVGGVVGSEIRASIDDQTLLSEELPEPADHIVDLLRCQRTVKTSARLLAGPTFEKGHADSFDMAVFRKFLSAKTMPGQGTDLLFGKQSIFGIAFSGRQDAESSSDAELTGTRDPDAAAEATAPLGVSIAVEVCHQVVHGLGDVGPHLVPCSTVESDLAGKEAQKEVLAQLVGFFAGEDEPSQSGHPGQALADNRPEVLRKLLPGVLIVFSDTGSEQGGGVWVTGVRALV